MPVQKRGTALAQGSGSRRQYRSCDQCRKSKRACDAPCLDLTRRTMVNNVGGQRPSCSYCARTNKRCTMEWARSQAQSGHGSRDLLFPWNDILELDYAPEPMSWESGSAKGDLSGSLLDYNAMLLSSMFNDTEASQENTQASMPDSLTSARSMSDTIPSYFSSYLNTSIQPPSDLELDSMYHQMWLASQASETTQTYSSLESATSKSPPRVRDSAWVSFNQRSSNGDSPQTSLSPFSIDQQMINTSNRHLTSANLLQIYHDVLEHNLSCWLSEMTCPYQRESRNTPHIVPERGSPRSNMIYQRTIRLDRVAQSCKLLQLTHTEDQAASKALHLAIMAFATQWAQGSHRYREKYSTRSLDDGGDDIADGIADEFDRTLQRHFWDQAQRALQDVADLESYRVACAELIFGLTQKPWNPSNQSPRHFVQERGCKFARDSLLSDLHDMIHKEGPPIYLERAARKLHALKYRCDAIEKGLGRQYGSRKNGPHGIEAMSTEDRETIGLLYWLAIMCDTLSSSVNERPVVVPDQECEHEGQKEIQQAENIDKSFGGSRWNLDLFLPGDLRQTHRTHWPCSYEAAAEDITKSAPVKVLLFRHLSYLQSAIRKGAPEEQIEDIVRMTMLLYQYWNRTHGAFFSELVQNYSAVPQRIQGWFLCISAHWHLAALMLADLLEFIDENALGMEGVAHVRISGQLARKVRVHSARELSDLARVGARSTINGNHLGVPQVSDFHHAVNESALLTEPWTIILIRAFTGACMVFLGEVDEFMCYTQTTPGQSSHIFDRHMEQAEDCVKGLWLLGKKSDMAREISETLSFAWAIQSDQQSKMCSPYPHCPNQTEYTTTIPAWKFDGDPDIVISSFFVYAILTNLVAFYAYFFADGIVPGDFYNNLDSLMRTKAQLLLKFITERCISPLFEKLSTYIPSSFSHLWRTIWHNRVLTIRKERLQTICLQLADMQLITGASILLVLYSTHCTITQYHFYIGSQLAYLSFVTYEATFMTIRDHLQGSLSKRLWRYLWIVVIFASILPTRILIWNNYFLLGDLYGASVQCALDKMSEGWDTKSALFVAVECYLLFSSFCSITISLFPRVPNFPPFAHMERFIYWILSWPSRHLLQAQGSESSRKRIFWAIMFVMIIPCREFFFSEGYDLLMMYVMLMYAGNNLVYERAEAANQGRQGDESEWGFGQILPVLLLAIPFSQFVEELCRIEHASKKGNLGTEHTPSSSHTISDRNRDYYELVVASNRSELARAWTMPSRALHFVSLSYP
ncbi:unnamed protein product [Penicillium glandicola]